MMKPGMLRRVLVPVSAMLLVSVTAARAEALSVRDVIELSRAGLSESVLLALIDVDRSIFAIDTATLKELKAGGVSDTVIVAMIRSGREPRADVAPPPVQEPVPEPAAQEPTAQDTGQVADTLAPGAAASAPQFIPYAVPVPVYVAVPVAGANGKNSHGSAQHARTNPPPNCFVSTLPDWGFGGRVGPPPAPGCK